MTRKPKIAGIFLIVNGGITCLVVILLTLLLWAAAEGMSVGFGEPGNVPLWLIPLLGLVLGIPAVMSIIGGVFSLKRRLWGLALAGSICGIICIRVLAVPALVLLILARDEFKNGN